jgi:hypothetical protein
MIMKLEHTPTSFLAAGMFSSTFFPVLVIQIANQLFTTALCPYYKLEWFAQHGYPPNCLRKIERMIEQKLIQTNPGPQATTSHTETIPNAAPASTVRIILHTRSNKQT